MVKFENKVAFNKINRLARTAPLLVFFHCKDLSVVHKDDNKNIPASLTFLKLTSLENLMENRSSKHSLPEQDFLKHLFKSSHTQSDREEKPVEKPSISLVKNKYLEKILSASYSYSAKQGGAMATQDPHKKRVSIEEKKSTLETNFIRKSSLLKGNRFAFFCKTPTKQSFVRDNVTLKDAFLSSEGISSFFDNEKHENKNIMVLGGVYDNKVIDHNQVQRLLKPSSKEQTYLRLNNVLKQSLNRSLSLSFYHHKMRHLLKILSQKQRD